MGKLLTTGIGKKANLQEHNMGHILWRSHPRGKLQGLNLFLNQKKYNFIYYCVQTLSYEIEVSFNIIFQQHFCYKKLF